MKYVFNNSISGLAATQNFAYQFSYQQDLGAYSIHYELDKTMNVGVMIAIAGAATALMTKANSSWERLTNKPPRTSRCVEFVNAHFRWSYRPKYLLWCAPTRLGKGIHLKRRDMPWHSLVALN